MQSCVFNSLNTRTEWKIVQNVALTFKKAHYLGLSVTQLMCLMRVRKAIAVYYTNQVNVQNTLAG
jgi:hypothetical protein